jgi:hypothetical protein
MVIYRTINMQDSGRHPTSNQRPILKSMSNFYITDICTSDLCWVFLILKSVSNSEIYVLFSNSQIGVQFWNLWRFLTFSNQRPMTSLTYSLNLTNQLAIDLRIWKGHRFGNALKSDCAWDNDISGSQFEEWTPI